MRRIPICLSVLCLMLCLVLCQLSGCKEKTAEFIVNDEQNGVIKTLYQGDSDCSLMTQMIADLFDINDTDNECHSEDKEIQRELTIEMLNYDENGTKTRSYILNLYFYDDCICAETDSIGVDGGSSSITISGTNHKYTVDDWKDIVK